MACINNEHEEPDQTSMADVTVRQSRTGCDSSSGMGPNAAHLGYVIAERNKRVRALWAETPAATQARIFLMQACGLSELAIRHHQMGLVSCAAREVRGASREAICIPVADKRGPDFAPCLAAEHPSAKQRGQYVLFGIPGLSGESHAVQWKRGPTLTMYLTPEKGKDLIVCSQVMDGLSLSQRVEPASAGRFTIIVSTHPDEHPPEWHAPEFWARWQRIYLAHSGDRSDHSLPFGAKEEVRCAQLARLAQRPVLRVRFPETRDASSCLDWPAYFNAGGTPQSALELFNTAQVFSSRLSVTQNLSCVEPPRLDEFEEGEYGDVTHDVSYNYVGGYYYYPFSVLQFSIGASQQKQITRLTRLLRNDGRIFGWARVPSANGTSDVIAADDGTLLSRPPEVSESATWSLQHILAYARATVTGISGGRSLAEILHDMYNLFEQCIWLPYREQFYLLLHTVPVTYVQELFSAVPYILIQGPKDSGKSELAHLLSRVSSNSTIIGSGSHAFTAAQVDQARGLIVLDDRETLAAEDLDADLLELLKIGYKRATGIRGIVGQNRKIIRQHVYGVKAITCVSGVEEVVGTRMLRIRTAPYSKARAVTPIRKFQAADQETADQLRQEMHNWAFRNVNLIRAEYEKLTQSSSRWDEITAPLRTFSALSQDSELQRRLDDALNAQAIQETGDLSVEQLLHKVMEDMVRRGLTVEVSITQIRNELALRLSGPTTQNSPCLDAELVPESWITRTLKDQGWLKAGGTVHRTRVRKKALQRIWELDRSKVTDVLQGLPDPPEDYDALSFCTNCNDCQYRPVCDIKKYFEPG